MWLNLVRGCFLHGQPHVRLAIDVAHFSPVVLVLVFLMVFDPNQRTNTHPSRLTVYIFLESLTH